MDAEAQLAIEEFREVLLNQEKEVTDSFRERQSTGRNKLREFTNDERRRELSRGSVLDLWENSILTIH